MNLLNTLLPALKPFIKQIFDTVVEPKLQALAAQIPNADAAALVGQLVKDIDAEIDSLLS